MDDARSVKDAMKMTGFFSDPLAKTDPKLPQRLPMNWCVSKIRLK